MVPRSMQLRRSEIPLSSDMLRQRTYQDQFAVFTNTAKSVPSSSGVIKRYAGYKGRVSLTPSDDSTFLCGKDGDQVVLTTDRYES